MNEKKKTTSRATTIQKPKIAGGGQSTVFARFPFRQNRFSEYCSMIANKLIAKCVKPKGKLSLKVKF